MEERFGSTEINGVKIYNTTPHLIRVLDENGQVILEIPKAPQPLRLPEIVDFCCKIGNIPLFRKFLSRLGLPPRVPNVYYVVALPIAQTIKRSDFIVPHDYVRDSEGNVIGCRAFAFID